MNIQTIRPVKGATKRVQLDLAETEIRQLDELMVECGLSTRKDLFNYALTLLKWSTREIKRGREIASINDKEESFTVLELPIFDSVRDHAAAFEPPGGTDGDSRLKAAI